MAFHPFQIGNAIVQHKTPKFRVLDPRLELSGEIITINLINKSRGWSSFSSTNTIKIINLQQCLLQNHDTLSLCIVNLAITASSNLYIYEYVYLYISEVCVNHMKLKVTNF